MDKPMNQISVLKRSQTCSFSLLSIQDSRPGVIVKETAYNTSMECELDLNSAIIPLGEDNNVTSIGISIKM